MSDSYLKKRVANKLMFSRLHSFCLFICSVCLYILSSGNAVKILLNLSDNISCGRDRNNNSRWIDSAQRSRMRSLYHSVFNESHKLQSIFHKERNKKLIQIYFLILSETLWGFGENKKVLLV